MTQAESAFQHHFFMTQQDGDQKKRWKTRSKIFKSLWSTQISIEENKLTEAFTLYLYITQAKTDESDFVDGFYEVIKAYLYLNRSSGSMDMNNIILIILAKIYIPKRTFSLYNFL